MAVNFMHKPDDRHALDLFSDDPGAVPARGEDASLNANEVAASYQPRRESFAMISIALNLAAVAGFVLSGAAGLLYAWLEHLGLANHLRTPIYLLLIFIAHAAVNFPLEFWAGYLEERQFGLAKHGIRAWSRDWLLGVGQHGAMFIIGACLVVMTQALWPAGWLIASAAALLVLFLASCCFAVNLLPAGLFQIEPADEASLHRLRNLAGADAGSLPRILIFSSPNQRDFAGGLLGLANRQALLISRSTIELASETLMRFVLLHELGHRRHRHVLLATLIGWAWIVAGVALCDVIAPANTRATPVFIAWLAMTLTAWLAMTEPLIAFVGRRMEYAADRHYLRHGGTLHDLHAALTELSRRNLARTDALPRRRTALHPLPSIGARLHRAQQFTRTTGADSCCPSRA